jgi:MFS family permease
MLLPAIPDIIGEFNISYNTSSWILTAYLIAGAVMMPIGGKLSDIYGRKKMVLIIMVIYIIGIRSVCSYDGWWLLCRYSNWIRVEESNQNSSYNSWIILSWISLPTISSDS